MFIEVYKYVCSCMYFIVFQIQIRPEYHVYHQKSSSLFVTYARQATVEKYFNFKPFILC